MNLRQVSCEDGRWNKLDEDYIRYMALVLAVLDLKSLLPVSVM